MIQNKTRARLKAGEAVVGTWLAVPSVVSARFMAQLGFDYLTVDMEHQPIDIETASTMFAAVAAGGVRPWRAYPWNTGRRSSGCWIAAPGGSWCRWSTRGKRREARCRGEVSAGGYRQRGGTLHAMSFGTEAATYYARANDEILVVVQAESPEGVANAEAILSVPGIDAVSSDRTTCWPRWDRRRDGERQAGVRPGAGRTSAAPPRRHGVAAGIHTANHEMCSRRLAQGFRFMAVASDARFMVAGAQAELSRTVVPGRGGEPGKEVLRY